MTDVFDPGEPATAQDYADRINRRWQDSVEAILDVGAWLVRAKRQLPHGEFLRMFANHSDHVPRPVVFSDRAGRMLMAVARNRALTDRNHGSDLPASWRTLYELSRLPPAIVEAAIEAGDIRPDMERGDVAKLVWQSTRNAIEPASMVGNGHLGDRKGDGWTVYLGAFTDRLADLDGDVDLVATDPPYDDDALGLYTQLAEWAAVALCPGGVLATYAGTIRLPEVLDALNVDGLEYVWTLALDMTADSQSRIFRANVLQRWKPIVVMCRPAWRSPPWGPDVLVSPARVKDAHPWQQNAEPVRDLVERYSTPGMVVCDPFLGSGTTGRVALELGRQFIGCDIDPACVAAFEP